MKLKSSSDMELKAHASGALAAPNLNLPSALWYPRWLGASAWIEHLPFAFWMMEAAKPQRFVELGTHFGTSYFAFCQAAERLELGCQSWAIDTWKGDEHAGFYGDEIYEKVRSYNDANYSGFSSLIRSTFDDALPYFPDGSIDLLHIDGHHSFDSVRHDFESWLPKLSERAVVLFHDTNVKERHFGVGRFFDSLKRQYPWFDFPHGHGLGVVGVGKVQTPLLQRLFQIGDHSSETQSLRSIFSRLGHACADAASANDLRERNSHLEAEVVRHRNELDSIRIALTGAQELAHSRSGEVGDLSQRLQAAIDQSAAIRGEWAERVTSLIESREEMAKAHQREMVLSEAIAQELRRTLEAATARESSLLDSLTRLETKCDGLVDEISQLKKDASQQMENFKGVEGEMDRLHRMLSEREVTLSTQAETLAFKSQALADVLAEKEWLSRECEETKRQVSELQTQLLNRDDKIDAQERALVCVSESLALEHAEKIALSEQLSQATNRSEEQRAALMVERDDKFAAQDAMLQSLSNALENAQAHHEALSGELEHSRRHSATLEQERDALQANVDERLYELTQTAKLLLERDDKIAAQEAALYSQVNALNVAQAQHGALSEELEHSRRHSAALERERDALQANVDERFRELAQIAKMIIERDDKIAALEESLQSQASALEAAKSQHGALSEELEHSRRHSLALEQHSDALQANVDERFRELAHLAQIFMHKDMAIEDSRAAAAKMKASASWRVTKPLRWFGNTFGSGAKEKKRLRRQCALISQSGLFDAAWYSSTYPDVVQSGIDPVEHYLRHGAREGRNPSPRFHTQNYLRRYPDVAKATPPLNPLLHYVLHGKKEGRFA
jgi:predicted nuclease with TOPRIM domain